MANTDRTAYLAKWRAANRDKTRAAQRKYYAANRDKCLAAVAHSRTKNPEPARAASRKYLDANHEVVLSSRRAAYQTNRSAEIARVRRRNGKLRHGMLWTTPAEQVEIDGLYLFTRCFPQFEVDHITPLNGKMASGLHVLGNLQVLPSGENRAKGNKFCPALVELVQQTRNCT